jgi:DNA-3-methyladenine glycosylase I
VAAIVRCPWSTSDSLSEAYHDTEWGVPVRDDRALFEFLILEGAQAGLSWITILKKRAAYREAFDNFDAAKIARYQEAKLEKLLANPGIVRNRLKVHAAVRNARACLAVTKEFGGFHKYLWQFVDGQPIQNTWKSHGDIPASTPSVGRHEQRLEEARVHLCRFDDLLRLHAGDWHGERPFGQLLSLFTSAETLSARRMPRMVSGVVRQQPPIRRAPRSCQPRAASSMIPASPLDAQLHVAVL